MESEFAYFLANDRFCERHFYCTQSLEKYLISKYNRFWKNIKYADLKGICASDAGGYEQMVDFSLCMLMHVKMMGVN